MKKLLLTLALVGSVSGAFAQGTVGYNNRVTGSVDARIYAPEIPDGSVIKTGNTSAGTPAGTQVYTGGWLTGSQYRIQLWAGAAGTAEGALSLVPNSNRSFRTSTATGTFGLIDTAPGAEIEIPGVLLGQQAALQLRVWDTTGGINTWQAAVDAGVTRGASLVFTSLALGGGTTPAPNMAGLQSFNVYAVPEPSTFVLAGLGAAALMIIRRRK